MVSKIKQIRNIILDNSQKNVSPATSPDTNKDAIDLADSHPYQVAKTIKNCRYVYNNESIVSALILNNALTANNRFVITTDNKNIPNIDKAIKHIESKIKEWKLDSVMNQALIKGQRDGKCFIQKAVIDGTIKINFLAYDGEDYDMRIITDPKSGEIIGFKQKYPKQENIDNWMNVKFDELIKDTGETDEANFLPKDMIYFTIVEEDNEGESFVMSLLDEIYDLWTYKGFKVSVSHKTGALTLITVGNEDVSTDKVPNSFIDSLMNVFKNPVKNQVGAVPYGADVKTVGTTNLPDLPGYMKDIIDVIFIKLQTPRSVFIGESSNRAIAEVQTNDHTGYKVFINFLRDTLRTHFEGELIDYELELAGFSEAVGHVIINFDKSKDDELEPLKPKDLNAETILISNSGDDGELDEEGIIDEA